MHESESNLDSLTHVERNKETKSNRNNLRTGGTTPSNNKKTFLTVDKTINYQRKSTKVKIQIVISSNQKMLQRFVFKGKETISKHRYSSEPKQFTQMEINTITTNNTSHGEKLNTIHPNCLRIFYTNINGIDLGKSDHSLLQLCQTLKSKEVDIICVTETNVH